MEKSTVQPTEVSVEMDKNMEPKDAEAEYLVTELKEESCSESVKKGTKVLKTNVRAPTKGTDTVGTSGKKIETKSGIDSSVNHTRSKLARPTLSSASRTSGSVTVARRSSTGGLPEKQPMVITKRQSSENGGRASSSLASEPLRKSLPELRKSTVSSIGAKPPIKQSFSETRKSIPNSPVARSPRTPASSDSSKQDSLKRISMRSSPLSVSSVKKVSSPLLDSSGSSTSIRKSVVKVSPNSARSPTISSGSKSGSLSTSLDRSSSSLLGRKKVGTPESRDSRLIMLPQVEVKAGDDVVSILRACTCVLILPLLFF